MGTSTRVLVLGGGAAIVVAAATLIWKDRATPPVAPAATATTEAAVPEQTTTATTTEQAAETAPLDQAAGTATADAEVVVPPAFDVVRITPQGDALVAGRAAAGSAIKVMIDGAEAAKAVADGQGKFVAMFTLPPSASPRVVKLAMQPETGSEVASTDQVVLAPTPATTETAAAQTETTGTTEVASAEQAVQPEATAPAPGATEEQSQAASGTTSDAGATTPGTEMVAADPATATDDAAASTANAAAADATAETAAGVDAPGTAVADTTATGTAGATEESTAASASIVASGTTETAQGTEQPGTEQVASAADTAISAEAAPVTETEQAPTAVLVTDTGAKVLQGAAGMPDNVTIGAISYSSTGAVQLSGHGKGGSPVRLYLDNVLALETTVAADGGWAGTLAEVTPGVYTLRADQLDASGAVASRYETPFQREAPDVLAALRSRTGKPVNITVQPGFTLWEIAKQNYGDGVMYVRVFEANKAQIKDPDLIYPGQVFAVPKKS